MKITKEQAMAYREVVEVLKYISKEEIDKIPEEVVKYYKDNMDTTYEFYINTEKSFEEQVLMEKTKIVLAMLYRDYWATEEQREKIRLKEKYDINKIETENQEKYDVENIFKQKQEKHAEEELALVECKKETWYSRFINFMKSFFKGNNK